MGVFALPSLGSDMETGTLVEWLVSVGDTVQRGDVVAVIETQKGAIEIECFQEGTLHALLAEPGEELPVGAPLAMILAPGEAAPDTDAPPAAVEASRADVAARRDTSPAPARAPASGVVPASPAARRRAQELGIDLSSLTGSFPNGGIVLADVEELSYKEIAEIVGCPIGTVMSRLHRARKKMQKRLTAQAVQLGIIEEPAAAQTISLDAYRKSKEAAG